MDEQTLTMLQSKKDVDRMRAAKKIGEQKNAKYLKVVTRLLDDPNQSVRCWAAWALGEIGDRRSIQPLIRVFVKYNKISKTDNGQESRCLTAFYLALEKLSGKRFGLDVSKWEQWWIEENLLALVSGLP
jgi:HEAT repeat protein